MSLPPLPDVFGNYAIRGIEEIIAPGPISWLPQTPAWIVIGLLALALLTRLCWRRWKTWRDNRYRAVAIERLAQTSVLPPLERLQSVSSLLKATALHAYPREQVASLSGERWVEWLQMSAGQRVFSASSAELLQLGQYQRDHAPDQDQARLQGLGQLIEECADWIRCHGGNAGD